MHEGNTPYLGYLVQVQVLEVRGTIRVLVVLVPLTRCTSSYSSPYRSYPFCTSCTPIPFTPNAHPLRIPHCVPPLYPLCM